MNASFFRLHKHDFVDAAGLLLVKKAILFSRKTKPYCQSKVIGGAGDLLSERAPRVRFLAGAATPVVGAEQPRVNCVPPRIIALVFTFKRLK